MNFKNIKSKENLVLFGAGYIAEKTYKNINKKVRVVDNSVNLQGTFRKNISNSYVESPDSLDPNKDFIVICSTALDSITKQIEQYGFKENVNFCSSPLLDNYIAIHKLESYSGKFLFSSGSAPSRNLGGGLYEAEVKEGHLEYKKLHSGFVFGIIKAKERLLFIDTDKGVMELLKDNSVKNICELPKDSRAHGISYNDSLDRYYISCSNLDAVLELNAEFQIIRQINLSSKKDSIGYAHHHTNDNVSFRNSIYVSMFSSTGNWKEGIFDGAVVEFDIETGKRVGDVITNLYMPHNVVNLNGDLCVLDSLRGNLLASNSEVNGTFPGFTRGVDFDGEFYLIGQSKNRNYSKVIGLSNNISIDCSVILFDPNRKVSRSFQLPLEIGEIHSIKIC